MGTIYRHFPTRADLVIAVYRHQVDACAEAGPALLASSGTPHAALTRWIDLFVDFLVTKHGLAAALQSDQARRCRRRRTLRRTPHGRPAHRRAPSAALGRPLTRPRTRATDRSV